MITVRVILTKSSLNETISIGLSSKIGLMNIKFKSIRQAKRVLNLAYRSLQTYGLEKTVLEIKINKRNNKISSKEEFDLVWDKSPKTGYLKKVFIPKDKNISH